MPWSRSLAVAGQGAIARIGAEGYEVIGIPIGEVEAFLDQSRFKGRDILSGLDDAPCAGRAWRLRGS